MKKQFVLACCFFIGCNMHSLQAQKMENSAPNGRLLVANQSDGTLSVIEPESGRMLAKVPNTDVRGHEVVASPDGRLAYVPIYGDSGVGKPGTDGHIIQIIDLKTNTTVGSIDLGRPVRPHCAVFGPDGLLYVTAELDKSIDVIDPRQQKRIASIPTGQPESHMLVMTKDGKRGYTSNVGVGTVSVVDLSARKLVTVIPVAEVAQRISISVDDRYVFTADQKQARLAVIDTSENKVTKWIALPAIAYGTAPTADGKSLLVTLPSVNQVAVVNLAEMKVAHTVNVPAHPQEVLIRPDRAYISCNADGKVAVIDTKEWRMTKTLDSAAGADGLAWAN